jgi:WD40 repeat protein
VRIGNVLDGKWVSQVRSGRDQDDRSRDPVVLRFMPDQNRLAIGTAEGDVLLWNLADEKMLWDWRGCLGGVVGLGFSGDGQQVLAGSKEAGVFCWSLQDGELVQRWPIEGEVKQVAFAPDGKRALVLRGEELGEILILEGPTLRRAYALTGPCGAWGPKGHLFVTGTGEQVWVWPTRGMPSLSP